MSDLVRYSRVQRSYVWLLLVAAIVVAVSAAVAASSGGTGVGWVVLVGVTVLALLSVFSRLTVVVVPTAVVAHFGWGWPRRRVELDRIVAVRPVRNKWWYGYGVRKVPNGWMYNVAGLDAVELELAEGRVFRIGTDDVQPLVAALVPMIGRSDDRTSGGSESEDSQ